MFFYSESFLLTPELFPILQLPLFGEDGVALCKVADAKFVFGAENVIETVVNVGVFGSDLKWGLGELCWLRLDLDIAFLFVFFLMVKLILVEVVDLIQLPTLELLRFDQGVDESRLVRQWSRSFFMSCVYGVQESGYFVLVCVVEIMTLNMLLNLWIEVLLVTGRAVNLEVVFVVRFWASLVQPQLGLGHLVELAGHHGPERQKLSLVLWLNCLLLHQVTSMIIVISGVLALGGNWRAWLVLYIMSLFG